MLCHEEESSGYPAESALGSDNTRITTLKQFRDEVLASSRFGRALIKTYYTTAPVLSRLVNSSPLFKQMTIKLIDAILPIVKNHWMKNKITVFNKLNTQRTESYKCSTI